MNEIVTAGIDVGTSSVKVCLVASPRGGGRARAGARILANHLERIWKRDPRDVVRTALAAALARAGLSQTDLGYLATTGEGELVENRTGHFYSMTCHARGAVFLAPECRSALDLGALHGRAIRLDAQARVLDYRMTSQCASGSGQFLENISRYLGVTLDEVGALSLKAAEPEKVSSICAVLAETDVINMVSRGIAVGDILRGIHDSMAARYGRLLLGVRAEGVALVTGGLAADEGLIESLRCALSANRGGPEVRTHALSAHAGAIGAALWGAFRFERVRLADRTSLAASAAPAGIAG